MYDKYVEIAQEILKANLIGITFHTSPDGDASGSALGLLTALRHLKKDSYITSRDQLQDNLYFLPLSAEVDGYTQYPVNGTDLVIILDCGSRDRISSNLIDYEGKIINIDHHITNENFGDINLVDPKAAATAEIIYLLLKELNIDFESKEPVVERIGRCLYTGIVTDTGSFRHSNVTPRTHEIAAKLIAAGVNNNKVHSSLFDNKPFKKLKLMGYALSNAELVLKQRVSYIELPKKILESLNMENYDTSDIISNALAVENVEVAVLLKEVDDGVKASFRSKNDVDARKIAESLGGGGHIKAAGLKLKNVSLETAKEKILKAIEREL